MRTYGIYETDTTHTNEGNKQPMITPQRTHIKPGLRVRIVQKQDQASGKLTEGIVQDILTNSASHPHGIKVRLTDGKVGRVKEIVVQPVSP
jgi:uncharacterized repeat protein (TIGR03833 family)